jgi:hypothetical protein
VPVPDPLYVAARRVLLDALAALEQHLEGVVLVGAQAIYAHTGEGDLAVAPHTTDGDLALSPTDLAKRPTLEEALRGAGFVAGDQPGRWIGADSIVIDLMVPDALRPWSPGRAARAARWARRAQGARPCRDARRSLAHGGFNTRCDIWRSQCAASACPPGSCAEMIARSMPCGASQSTVAAARCRSTVRTLRPSNESRAGCSARTVAAKARSTTCRAVAMVATSSQSCRITPEAMVRPPDPVTDSIITLARSARATDAGCSADCPRAGSAAVRSDTLRLPRARLGPIRPV